MKKATRELGEQLKARLRGGSGNTVGRVRLSDDSMRRARVRKGDVVRIRLDAAPKQNKLCAAFTSWGELVVRRYYRKENGDVRLSTGARCDVPQVFAPGALIVLGPVVGIERAA